MVKVLEHGKDYHETSCVRCNAKLSYLKNNVSKSGFIRCPECNFLIRVYSLTIEEANLKHIENCKKHKTLVDLCKIHSWEELKNMNNIILQLKKISINLKNYFCKIYINYSKEDYFSLKEDFFQIRAEIYRIEKTIKECEKFIDNTFEDKFGHNPHFKSIDKEIEYYKCLLSSKKEGAAELYKRMGCEDRLNELEKRKERISENE